MTKPFAELTPAEADEVVAAFVASRPQALAGLRDRLVADGQDADAVLDGSVDGLVPLWAWIKGELRHRDDDAGRSESEPFEGQPAPAWYRHDCREERMLSLDSVHLLDGLVSYIGEVVMGAVPGATWRRGQHPVRAFAHRNRPVLARGDEQIAVGPMVFGSARSHLHEPGSSRDDQPRARVERWIDELRRADGPESDTADDEPLDAVLDQGITVERGDVADEWFVEFGDDVALLVGQPAIDRLAHVLPGNAGVSTAAFEDREVLVANGGLDPAALKRWIVAELTRTATRGGCDAGRAGAGA
jgi:hypothetical protein